MIPYEISFIFDDRRCQFPFLGTDEQAQAIHAALEADFSKVSVALTDDTPAGEVARQVADISNLQVYPPLGDPSSAEEILDVIEQECMDSEDDEPGRFARLRAMASAIDESARAAAATETCTMEFVWDVGGGDDNAYSSSFLAASDDDQPEAFEELLTSFLEDAGYAYDIGMSRSAPPPTRLAQEALQDVYDSMNEATDLDTVFALLESGTLESGPAATPAKPFRP